MKKRKRKTWRRLLLLLAATAILGTGFLHTGLADRLLPPVLLRTNTPSALADNLDPPTLYSKNAVLIRQSDCKTLFDLEGSRKIYPASLTKIMTALVALESLNDLSEPVTLSASIFPTLTAQDASMAGFLADETVPAIDLLYGILLPSGAEASVGLATYIAGSEASFVQQMNEKAKSLGLRQTHFTNVCGLHDPDHYSTVYDLAILLEHALENPDFLRIFTSVRHSTSASNRHPDGITFYSTLAAWIDIGSDGGVKILGGKTGYTSEAGLCLASLAEVDGERYILVTVGAPGDHTTEPYHLIDAMAVYRSLPSDQ